MNSTNEMIWIFHGAGGRFTSGVFSSVEKAEAWIKKYGLTGVLTEYPLDTGAYDWAIARGTFKTGEESHSQPNFIQKFTSASQEHYHYEDGERDS